MYDPKKTAARSGRRRTSQLRMLLSALAMILIAGGMAASPAVAASRAHSVSVLQKGATAEITVDVTLGAGDVGLAPAYMLTVKDRSGKYLGRSKAPTPTLTAGRQSFTVSTTNLTNIGPGDYTGELRVFNGRRVVLKQDLSSIPVTDETITPPQPPIGTSPLDPALKRYVEGLPNNTNVGLRSLAGLTKPTAANLPSGVTINGTNIEVKADGVTLQGWDFDGFRVNVKARNVTVTGNLFGERSGASDVWHHLHVSSNADGLTVEGNSFLGFDGEAGQAVAAIYQDLRSGQAASGLTVRFNRFENMQNDAIKIAGEGATVQWNAFMLARNLSDVPAPWSPTKIYRVGDYALNQKGHAFRSTANGNRGVAVPTTVKGTSNPDVWQWVNPHVDHITVYAAKNDVTISYNYFSTGSNADRVFGMVNAVRLIRNRDTTYQYDRVVVQGNYIEPNLAVGGAAISVSSDNNPNFDGPIEVRHNWIGVRKGGLYVRVDNATPIWDNNVDAITDQAPAVPSNMTVRNTVAPKSSVTPQIVRSGHR